VVYGIARVLASAVGLVLLPVYTRYFSVAEYGIIENLNVLSYFIVAVASVSIPTAVTHFYGTAGSVAEERTVVSSATFATLALALLTLLLGAAGLPWLGSTLVQRSPAENTLLVGLAILGATASLPFGLYQTLFTLKFQTRPYLVASLGSVVLTTTLSLVFLLVLRLGLTSVFLAAAIAYAAGALYGAWMLRGRLSLAAVSPTTIKQLLAFGSSFVFASFATLVIKSSDRYFITLLRPDGLVLNGLYATAEKFMMPLTFIGFAFGTAWGPFALAVAKQEDARQVYVRSFKYYVAVTSLAAVACAVASPYLIRFVTTPAYYQSHVFTPAVGVYLALNYLFYIGSLGFLLTGKSHLIGPMVAVVAAVNAALNWWWIPTHGVSGAIWATNVALVVYNVAMFSLGERYYEVGFPLGRGLALYGFAWLSATAALSGRFPGWLAVLVQLTVIWAVGFADIEGLRRLLQDLRARVDGR
jgi:O-antigen/teichoic acid export membrane protein